jgi:hypothetical protein
VRSSGDNSWCSDSVETEDRNHFFVMILCVSQDIWVAVRWVGMEVEIGKGYR